MGNNRFVVPIPFWLYALGIMIAAVLWTGIIIFILGAILVALVIYALVGLIAWMARVIRERKNGV